jgi:hypothetical protein
MPCLAITSAPAGADPGPTSVVAAKELLPTHAVTRIIPVAAIAAILINFCFLINL